MNCDGLVYKVTSYRKVDILSGKPGFFIANVIDSEILFDKDHRCEYLLHLKQLIENELEYSVAVCVTGSWVSEKFIKTVLELEDV